MKFAKIYQLIGMLLLLTFVSCAYLGTDRKPARQIQNINADIERFNEAPIQWVEELTHAVQNSSEIEKTCFNQILPQKDLLIELDFESMNRKKISEDGREWLKKSFLLKKSLNGKLPQMSKECRLGLVEFFELVVFPVLDEDKSHSEM